MFRLTPITSDIPNMHLFCKICGQTLYRLNTHWSHPLASLPPPYEDL